MPDRELSSLLRPGPAAFVICLVAAAIVGQQVAPTWLVKQLPAIVETDSHERETAIAGDARIPVLNARPAAEARLVEDRLNDPSAAAGPELREELIYESNDETGERDYFILVATRHWGWWSFLPAVTAIALCFITKEPITALLGGIVVGGALIGKANILDEVVIPAIGSPRAASILILYLWLLGGLMGIWAQTGATKAFADYVSARFVRGPRSAKVVAWLLGVAFFQGGTVSSVLVGTTVRPLADKERVSHEELSLIVDATSSPIAVLLAFNAWPIYVQALIGVSGVAYLATEADRIAFFFHCIPYSFYAMFSVFFTFLLAIDRLPLAPRKLREARQRARETGQLNAPGAEPLAAGDLVDMEPPDFYAAHYADFLLPLVTLLAVAIGTYVYGGSPQVLWAFSIALLLACLLAAWKGMSLRQIVMGIIDGQKSVV